MSKLVDILIQRRKAQEKYFNNYLFYAKKIKKAAQELLGKVRIVIFGSILRKEEVPRDIDLLVISPKLKTSAEKSKIRVKLWRKLGFARPFEIHFITPEEYEDWYKKFIKKKIEI